MKRQSGYVEWWLVFGFALCGAVLVLAVVASVANEREWDKFKAAHQCAVVAHITGDVFNTVGIGSNGAMVVGVGSTPDKTGWRCDDGVTYYR